MAKSKQPDPPVIPAESEPEPIAEGLFEAGPPPAPVPAPDELARLRAENERLSAELAALKPAPAAPAPPPAPRPAPAPGFRWATVSVPGTHVGAFDVQYPADAADPVAAAIAAAKELRGIAAFGAPPVVSFPEQ